MQQPTPTDNPAPLTVTRCSSIAHINPGLIQAIHINPPTIQACPSVCSIQPRASALQIPTTTKPTHPSKFVCTVLDDKAGNSLEFQRIIKQEKYRDVLIKRVTTELGCLAQDIHDIPGTDTITFIPKAEVPGNEKVIYVRIVCKCHNQKDGIKCTHLTGGGHLIVCLDDVSAQTADMTTPKLLYNSAIFNLVAHFLTLDLKNFCLETPLPLY